jgi:hypothetical protein
MLAVVGGRERPPGDYAAIAHQAGLTAARVLRGPDGLLLVECTRPGVG